MSNTRPFYQLTDSCQIENLAQIYEEFFGQKKEGLFVEVGAFDGETVSNTSGLADAGWHGIYIEPINILCERCAYRHRNNSVEVFNTAIGDQEGNLELYFGSVLTTANPIFKRIYENTEWAKHLITDHKTTVPQTTLDTFLSARKLSNIIDLLVIDVEGHEYEVLQGFTIGNWQPRMIIIEVEDEHGSFKDRSDILTEEEIAELRRRFRSIRNYFSNADYTILFKDAINTIYVRSS